MICTVFEIIRLIKISLYVRIKNVRIKNNELSSVRVKNNKLSLEKREILVIPFERVASSIPHEEVSHIFQCLHYYDSQLLR